MKRDMDLVRKILFKMEEDEKRSNYSEGSLRIEGYSQKQVDYHMQIMVQAGLLHLEVTEHSYPSQMSRGIVSYSQKINFHDYSLSWDGHEFLEAARDNKRWEKAKGAMAQAGGFAIDVMKQLLVQYLKAELKLPPES